jgi:hypothetical protein
MRVDKNRNSFNSHFPLSLGLKNRGYFLRFQLPRFACVFCTKPFQIVGLLVTSHFRIIPSGEVNYYRSHSHYVSLLKMEGIVTHTHTHTVGKHPGILFDWPYILSKLGEVHLFFGYLFSLITKKKKKRTLFFITGQHEILFIDPDIYFCYIYIV